MRILAVVFGGIIMAGCQTATAPPAPVPVADPGRPLTRDERCARLVGIVGNQDVSPSIRMMAMEAARNNECLGQRPPVRVEIR